MKVYELIQALAQYKADDEVRFHYYRTLEGQEVLAENGNYLTAQVDVDEFVDVYEYDRSEDGVCLMLE